MLLLNTHAHSRYKTRLYGNESLYEIVTVIQLHACIIHVQLTLFVYTFSKYIPINFVSIIKAILSLKSIYITREAKMVSRQIFIEKKANAFEEAAVIMIVKKCTAL